MEWRWRVFVAPRNAPTPRPHETGFPEDLSDQQGPEQSLRRNLGLLPSVSRILEIPSEAKTPCHIVEQMTGVAQFIFSFS